MAKRGRPKPASSKDDKSKRTDEESPSESVPLSFEYQTEDGLKVAIDPSSIEFSREYEVAEDLDIELSVEFEWSVADLDVKKGVDDLAVSGEIGLPGDILGIGGGIIIDLETGEIDGGEIGVELGGAEVELSVSESGCQIGMQISFMGIGIGINKDVCKDDEKDEGGDEDEIKKPIGGEPLTKEIVDDIMRRWREKGEPNQCEDIPLQLHTTWHAPDTPVEYPWYEYSIRFSRGGIWDDYASDAEENEMMVGWIWNDFIGYDPRERLIVRKGYEPSFDGCMAKLYEDDSTAKTKKITPPSPPPMRNKQDCCTETTKLLLELHKVFRVTEVLEKGFPLPANQVSPGGKGKLINKDYATILKRLFQAINMRTPAPFTAMVADADPTTPGDQPLTKTYPEATSAMQEVVELLLKNQIDDQTTLNFLIRQSILQGELMLVAQENRSILHTILYGSGIPFKETVGKVRIPFDLDPTPDEKKSKQEKALDVSQNDAVKKLLPEFLRTAEETYDAYKYDESAETLWYYITMLYMRLKGFK